MKHCPFCGTDYRKKLPKCPNCGASESQVKCEACGTAHGFAHCPNCGFGVNDVLRRCPRCGKTTKEAYCPDCGASLTNIAADPIPPVLRTRKGAIAAACVFLAVGLSVLFVPWAARRGAPDSFPRSATAAAIPLIQENEGSFGDAYVKIVSARRVADTAGDYTCVEIIFEWTNNSQWERFSGMPVNVYQNGVELLARGYPPDNNKSSGTFDNVLPGGTNTIRNWWRLKDTGTPIYVVWEHAPSGAKIVKTFENLED